MNYIIATVSQIENCDSLNVVTFNAHRQVLSMMSLDLNQKIKIGTQVKLVVKPAHIAIAKEFQGEVSYSNKLISTIKTIENGVLLSNVTLSFFDTTLESIITLNSAKRMNLQIGDTVTAFIKASELSISEVLDD